MQDKTTVYEFGDFRLDARQRVLSRGDEVITLTPKGFEVLLLLIRNHGQTLEKEELLRAAWPDTVVEESNLTQSIFVLRKVLGDDRNGHALIQTIPRRGYKFTVPVRELEVGAGGSLFPAGYWNRHSPFRGLQVFEVEDSWLFFGRDAEIEELLEHLRRLPVLVLIGNSGSGKSSLVRAGLVAAVQQGRLQDVGATAEWRTVVVRPSGAPFDYLAEALPGTLAPEMDPGSRLQFIADCRNRFPAEENALRHAIGALVTDQKSVLLVVDQFEELFTLTPARETRDRYIELLLAAAGLGGAVPIHLALVLRADFYAHCLEHSALARCLQTSVYNLPRMGREQLRESIEKRLALAGARAEAGLIPALLEDAGEEPGNLALLEHALGQLWERSFTNQAYEEIGRLRGALGRHADEVYESLGGAEQKYLAQKIFLELVQVDEDASVPETRRRVAKAELLSLTGPEQMEEMLARLASSRLISLGREFVEVSHEALIREWPRLRLWIAENRADLTLQRRLLRAAEEWKELGRDAGALLQGARLAQAEDWAGRRQDVPRLLREFIHASVSLRVETEWRERAEKERQVRRLRWFSVALLALLTVALGAAWFAHRQKILTDSRALAAQAEGILSQDHGRALDLAIKSWELAKTEEARLVVAKAFAQPLQTFPHDDVVYLVRFSPDGQKVITASGDRTAKVWSMDGRLLLTLKGHTDAILIADFSPNGERIVTASFDHTARIWNSSDGALVAVLKGHTDKLQDARFSPNGQRVVTASYDHTARIWNAADGRLIAVLAGHHDYVVQAQFSSDGRRVVTGSYDKTARVWDAADGHLLRTLEGHSGGLLGAGFFPQNDRVLTLSWDGTARIWDSNSGQQLALLQHGGAVSSVAFSPDGRRIVTASYDHTARVWDSTDGRLLFTLPHEGEVVYADYSDDGRYIITSSYDHRARIWNSANGKLLAILQGHTGMLYSATFSPDGRYVLTSSADHTARLWPTFAARSVHVLQGHTGFLVDGAFSPDDRMVVTTSDDHTARIWNTADGRLLTTLQGHKNRVYRPAISPNGQRIATASADHNVMIWNAVDGRRLATLQGHSNEVAWLMFSPDGGSILTGSLDHTARIWSASDFRLLAVLDGHTGPITSAVFSPDGRYILTTSEDTTGCVWDATNGRLIARLNGHTGIIYRSNFSPDSRRIVTVSADNTARVWSTESGALQLVLRGHTSVVLHGTFSPDGQRIVTASYDGTARLWNTGDGQLIAVLRGHTDQVRSARFSPDGKQIVTASYDNTARVWDGVDGHPIAVLQGHTGLLWNAVFSHDGQSILTVSADQTARLWRLLTLEDINNIIAK